MDGLLDGSGTPPDWLLRFREHLGGGRSQNVELIETHISWVLLVDGFAYKVKKPVILPFLDYGSPARRHFFCDEELRLNRRFAPALYLDVIPVAGFPVVDEWAVRMRRFAEAGRLDHVCARGELTPSQLSGLARTIVSFHDRAPAVTADAPFGEPARILAQALENFDELRQLLADQLPRLGKLQDWTQAEFSRQCDLIKMRKLTGRVRECHGDLHLGNLVLIDDQITPFDCIEFNPSFRWIDVVSELAFTYIDLLDHRCPDLAGWLVNEWLAGSGDFAGLPLLRFYAVYRALVRAKIASIRRHLGEAADYLALAEKLVTPPQPSLTITFGLAGSGKTQASGALLMADASASTLRLRSDVERKRLYGFSAEASSQSGLGSGLYTAEAGLRTYDDLAEKAGSLLTSGWSVIVDATFLKRRQREVFHRLAETCRVPFKILACAASTATLQQRIAERRGDASEATGEVLEQQLKDIEPLSADEQAFVISGN